METHSPALSSRRNGHRRESHPANVGRWARRARLGAHGKSIADGAIERRIIAVGGNVFGKNPGPAPRREAPLPCAATARGGQLFLNGIEASSEGEHGKILQIVRCSDSRSCPATIHVQVQIQNPKLRIAQESTIYGRAMTDWSNQTQCSRSGPVETIATFTPTWSERNFR